ncbi:hypothetical protein [Leptolyngbya sp. PCC 6406]|nr:hypothetical protein [Leptolyngbya sp. PCC 6406]
MKAYGYQDIQIEDLLKAAGMALYRAKDAGRDRIVGAPALEPHSR